jgi:L-lactate dehydrogenase complex protein LldE
VKGLKLVEMKDGDTCCGWGSTFATKFEGIATELAAKKVNQILDSGAEYVISTDMGCLMHLQGYINKNTVPLKVMHLADVLAG